MVFGKGVNGLQRYHTDLKTYQSDQAGADAYVLGLGMRRAAYLNCKTRRIPEDIPLNKSK